MNDARPLLSEIARLKAELAAADKATREVLEWAANALDAAVAKEREACAKVADDYELRYGAYYPSTAVAIRARTTEAK